MFENVIADSNPHWDNTPYQEGQKRELLDKIMEYIELPHIISLVGIRRSGKSTLARQIINRLIKEKGVSPKNILFLNLENPTFSRYRNDITYLERAYEDYLNLVSPKGFIYCILDEVHFFPEWQIFVKSLYEKKNIKFIVSSSNSQLIAGEYITMLSGRCLPVDVYPFSFNEFSSAKKLDLKDRVTVSAKRNLVRKYFEEYLNFGGFPETTFIDDNNMKKEILSMYAKNILYQDIAPRFGVKKIVELENLFFYLASNITSLFTYNRLSNLTGLSDKTVKDFMGYFEDAYLLFNIDQYSFSARHQIKSPKKIYSIDPGITASVGFNFSENAGRLLENAVYIELKRRKFDLFYYKTSTGGEVDFACCNKGKIIRLVQVCKEIGDEKTRNRELKALVRALEETGLDKGLIITNEDEDELTINSKTISILPAYKFFVETES